MVVYHFYLSVLVPRKQPIKHRYTIPPLIAAVLSVARVQCADRLHQQPLFHTILCHELLLYRHLSHLRLRNALFASGPSRSALPPCRTTAKSFFRIPPQWLGRIFVTSDVLSFMTQDAGSGIAASGNWERDQKDIGTNVLSSAWRCSFPSSASFWL